MSQQKIYDSFISSQIRLFSLDFDLESVPPKGKPISPGMQRSRVKLERMKLEVRSSNFWTAKLSWKLHFDRDGFEILGKGS